MAGTPTKRCSRCGTEKPLSGFYADRGSQGGYRTDCKACNLAAKAERHRLNPEPGRERARRWNRNNPERYAARQVAYVASGRKRGANRKSHLKRNFGLTLDDYEQMLVAQGGGCAICGRTPRADIALHVDHDHQTGAVRGLLCFRCNNALGDFDSDPVLLRAAIDYLEALIPAPG